MRGTRSDVARRHPHDSAETLPAAAPALESLHRQSDARARGNSLRTNGRASHAAARGFRVRRLTVIAALFVLPDGPYADVNGVDCWDHDRDARLYRGPYKVIAHPPCERWGRYWCGGPSVRVRRIKGDDGGCFAAALDAVRQWGGVLEHPAASAAWKAYGLIEPPRAGGWVVADWQGGWTCCVDQGHYGHRAQKATWLYAVGVALPSLTWGKSSRRVRLDQGFHSAAERRRKIQTGTCQRLSKRQRTETPIQFRDVLLSMCQETSTYDGVGRR